MKALRIDLEYLIKRAEALGLDESDLRTSVEFLEHREFGLCFDTIITQMYERSIVIDPAFYELVSRIGNQMDVDEDHYTFLVNLIVDVPL